MLSFTYEQRASGGGPYTGLDYRLAQCSKHEPHRAATEGGHCTVHTLSSGPYLADSALEDGSGQHCSFVNGAGDSGHQPHKAN